MTRRTSPIKRRNKSFRGRTGAMAAEYVATMYVLFIFMFFPILNLGVVGLNAFFLWFTCNCAATVGGKSQCFQQAVQIPAGVGQWYPGAYDTARAKATELKSFFPGINWVASAINPEVRAISERVDPAAPIGYTHIGPGPWPASERSKTDTDQYTLLLRVTINGSASPLINVPWFDTPGLSRPMDLVMMSQAQFENPPGLLF